MQRPGFPARRRRRVELACNLLREAVTGGAARSGVSAVVTGPQKTKQITKIKK